MWVILLCSTVVFCRRGELRPDKYWYSWCGCRGQRTDYSSSSRGADQCRPKNPSCRTKMSQWLSLLVVSCVLVVNNHAAPSDEYSWKEDAVSYSNFQIWSAKPRCTKELEFLRKIRQDYGN